MKLSRGFNGVTLAFLAAWSVGCVVQELDLTFGKNKGKSSSLVVADSCEDIAKVLKDKIAKEMDARLQSNLNQALEAVNYSCDDYWGEEEEEEEEEEEASEYSGTNVQVADVDEADFVKNDGGYLYVLADNHFWVLDAWPAAEAHTLSSTPIEGTLRRMYVHADKAVIYSSLDEWDQVDAYDPWHWHNDYYGEECTYGYDCDFTGDGRKLKVTILDISDRTAPELTEELEFNGSYLNSRRVGMDVHTAVVFPEFRVAGLSYWPQGLPLTRCGLKEQGFTQAKVEAMFKELRDANLALIYETPVTDLLPRVRDTRYGQGKGKGQIHTVEGPLSSCDEVYLSQTGDDRGFLSLVSFNIGEEHEKKKEKDLAAATIMSRPGAVYGSKDSMYIAVRHKVDPNGPGFAGLEHGVVDATTIHKFALDPGGMAPKYAASGVVKGRVLNQFAMDEHDGIFRIAGTSGHLPSPDVHSTVTTLRQQGSQLVELGRVDHLAPTEDIRSVRFNGEIGYVVTFKKTDPLFVINLAKPSKPFVEAELKIPGYSTYMHIMDQEHLLTMGYDAEEHGHFAYFQGLQLQVIDVSDLQDPKLIHKEKIGTRGSTSEAATNHLGFTYFRSRNLLAVPMTICEDGGGGQYGDLMTFSGLLVYRVTTKDGFELLGGVPHEEPETEETWSGKCNNWWTDSNSKVKRSVFLENWVFSIARDLINVAHIDDLENPAVSIPLVAGP